MKLAQRITRLRADTRDFAPGLLRLENQPPSPLPRVTVWVVGALVAAMAAWSAVGEVDVIAVAPGKLVPQTYLKIVQPAEPGVVREILVREGERVSAGQVLMRMDTQIAQADTRTLESELALRRMQLRRIEAELSGRALKPAAGESAELFRRVEAQYRANRQAYEDALGQEQAVLQRAREELAASRATQDKLQQVLPVYREREAAFEKLARDGFAGKLLVLDRQRERIEKEQELTAQGSTVASLQATIQQSQRKLAQIGSNYRAQLEKERVDTHAELEKLDQQWAKQSHRNALLELKAPQSGVVKDLATHTVGTVVSPGTILMSVVPQGEPLHAEVWVANEDVGFVRAGQPARLKIAAYPFQKYGLVEGKVLQVSADATDPSASAQGNSRKDGPAEGRLSYRATVALDAQTLRAEGKAFELSPGMQLAAEISLGTRTVLEYLLSPVQKTLGEAGRER